MGFSSCQPAAYHLSLDSPLYQHLLREESPLPQQRFDGFIESSQDKPQASDQLLEQRIHRTEEPAHGPYASGLDFVFPTPISEPAELLEEYGPRISEMFPLSNPDPQLSFFGSSIAFPQRNSYAYGRFLGVPFTVSSSKESTYKASFSDFSSDDFERDIWMIDSTSSSADADALSTSHAGKFLRYLLFQGDDVVSKTYQTTMHTLAKTTDTPVQLIIPGGKLRIDLDSRRARLRLGLPFFESVDTTLEYEHNLEHKHQTVVKLMVGITF